MKRTLLNKKLLSLRMFTCISLFVGLFHASVQAQTSTTALQFDGVDDYVSLGTTKFNNLKSVTFAAWVYHTANSGVGFDEIVAKENLVSFAINNSNDNLRLNFGNGTSWGTAVESNISIPLNTWTHVAGTRDINTGVVNLFINGSNVGTGTNTLYGTNTNDAAIGHKPGELFENAAFEGKIDEFRIWSKSLCESELSSYNSKMIATSLPQLLASISFETGVPEGDNTSLATINDFMGNYNGTLMNFDMIGSVSNLTSGNSSILGNCSAYSLTTPTITTSGGVSICTGSSLTLTSSITAAQYYWSNGQTGETCIATTAGSYTVTTYDNNGCNVTSPSIVLNTASSYTLSSAAYTAGVTSFCRGLNQTITVRVTYTPVGSKSFSLQLSTDSTFASVNYSATATLTGGAGNLSFAGTSVRLWPAGKYYARVTSSCITNGSLSLSPIQVWAPLTSIQAISNSPVCSGDPLDMNATDGASTYVWSGPNGFSAAVKSATLNSASMVSGAYVVTATNSCGVYVGTTNVVINPAPSMDIVTTNASCPGASNGSIALVSTDPNTPLTYYLDNQPNGNSLFSDLSAGQYLVGVTNSKGCKIESSVAISDLDQTPPTVVTKDITLALDLDGNAILDPSQIDDGSSDLCGIQSITVEPAYFSLSQLGTNLATLTVTDNSGNTSQATAIVTIKDLMAPDVYAHPSLQVELGSDGVLTVSPNDFIIYAYDVSGIASVDLSVSSFNCSNIGENTVILNITDNNGNSTIVPVVVNIIDNTPPLVSANDLNVYLNNNGTASISIADVNNGSSDACGIQNMWLSQTEFDCNHLGPNAVVFSVTDVNGNTSSVDVIITVIDNLAPVIQFKSNFNLVLDANGEGVITPELLDSATLDNCSGGVSLSIDRTYFNSNDLGSNTVIVTAMDANGNTAVQAIELSVIDVEKPVVMVQPDQTRVLSKGCSYLARGNEFDPTSMMDNNMPVDATSAGITIVYTLNGATVGTGYNSLQGISFSQGNTEVTWTVTDGSGNIGTGSFIVSVLDQSAPIVVTKNMSITLPASGTTSITVEDINAGSSDNCSIQSMSITPTSFDVTNIGTNTVTLTAIDAAGNTASATATVTIAPAPPTFTAPVIFVNASNKVEWLNIPGVNNGSSTVIGSGTTFNGNQLTITSTGGNISSSTTSGIGVSGAGTSPSMCGGTTYMNETVNKSQTLKATLTNSSIGITGLIFRSTYAAKVMVNGRRNGQTVITFSKYMTANDYDTFDFTTACALRGICTVDEVEFKMSDRTSGCVRRWNQYEDNENNDYEDGTNLNPNCGFTINNMMLIVKQKDDCNVGSIGFKPSDGVYASKVVALSDNLSTGISNVHSLATNSDGIFTTGSPFSSNSAKRIVVGYNWLGLASAWEITSQCKIRSIRQGLLSNAEILPVGNALNLLVFEYKITSVSTNGQYIYGTRKNRSNGSIVDIRWRVNEYFQRVWVSDPQVIQYNKNGDSEVFNDEDVVVMDEAQNDLGDLNVSIYPNPSNDVFNFKLESGSSENFSIEVYDLMGRLIQTNDNLNAENNIAIGQHLNPGVYLVKVTQGTQVRYAKVTRLN